MYDKMGSVKSLQISWRSMQFYIDNYYNISITCTLDTNYVLSQVPLAIANGLKTLSP